MLRFWKACRNYKSSGDDVPYHLECVDQADWQRPRIVFLGGMNSLSEGVIHLGQATKMLSALQHGGVPLDKCDLYMPVCPKGTSKIILENRQQHFNDNPDRYACPEGEELSHILFPDAVVPKLWTLTPEMHRKAVHKLTMLASKTTLIGFSYGGVVIESMCNDLRCRLYQGGYTEAEANQICGSLMSYEIGPVHVLTEQAIGVPRLVFGALNDDYCMKDSNLGEMLDPEQHPAILHHRASPGTLALANVALAAGQSYFQLTRTKECDPQAPLFSTRLAKTPSGRLFPRADYVMVEKTSRNNYHHMFDLYLAPTRLISHNFANRKLDHTLMSCGTNPLADFFLKQIAAGVRASLRSMGTNQPRDGAKLLDDIEQTLTPAKKDELVITNLRERIGNLYLGDYANRLNRFACAQVSRGGEFKQWAKNETRAREQCLEDFDRLASKVRQGDTTLTHLMDWTQHQRGHAGRVHL